MEVRLMKQISFFLWIAVAVFGCSAVADAELTVIGTATYASAASPDYNTSQSPSNHVYQLIYDRDAPFGPIVWLDYLNDPTSYINRLIIVLT
jgi:hypothetical protein